ncbi:pilus assembly protein FimV [Candidatus Puniceispirillum sp.]|nr:pilus assembly protein FimV [Candidatus Puniceispirillum sp.]
MRVFLLTFVFAVLHMVAAQAAEPIVVLTYGENRAGYGSMSDEYSSHPMRENPDIFKKHEVLEAETLGHIMSEYYGGSGLNMAFVQIAILQFNRSAFVRGNPNFLYAGKTLHLPSVNQIRALITKEKLENRNASENGTRNEIFFFGG